MSARHPLAGEFIDRVTRRLAGAGLQRAGTARPLVVCFWRPIGRAERLFDPRVVRAGGIAARSRQRSGRYAELHTHSSFSFLDGASSPEELVEQAARLGLSGLALTD